MMMTMGRGAGGVVVACAVVVLMVVVAEGEAASLVEQCAPLPFFVAAARGDRELLDQCVTFNSSLADERDAVGCSVLIIASFNGHDDAALSLYRHGSHINAKCNNGNNAVAYAHLKGHTDLAQTLVRFGAEDMRVASDLEPCAEHEWSVAIRSGDLARAEECVLTGFDVNRPLDAGCPAIVSAAINKNVDAVLFLVVRGADPDKPCGDATTALMHAARRGDVPMAKALTAIGADVEAEMPGNGWTALTFATTNGQFEVAKYLHRLDMDFEEQEWTGTPLMWAAAMGQDEMLESLLTSHRRSQESLDARDEHGQTAVMWAAQTGHLSALMRLVKAGATLHIKTHAGWTPLMGAAYEGHHGVVEYLLRNNADKDARDRGGWTALMWAVVNNKPDIVQQLLDSGASAAPTFGGWSPILVAAATGNERLFNTMIHNGQDLMASLENGQTGQDLARAHGHHRFAEHLRHMYNARTRYAQGGNKGHEEL